MSEMFIPNSVWDQSHQLQYGIFELIEADMILEMMKDTFNQKVGLLNQYIVSPFTYQMQLAFRNTYKPSTDPYKYKIVISIEKLQLNLTPQSISDMMKFQQYFEMISYIREI